MRLLFSVVLSFALAGSVSAQRRGGGMMGGGMRSGGHGLNGGFNGGGFRGGHTGFGGFGGFRGYNGFRGFGGYRNSFYSNFGFGFGLGWGWPGYYSGYYSYPYYGGYYDGFYPYDAYAGYAAASPAVSVVYAPQPQIPPVYVAAAPPERAHPVTREYDRFGQEVGSGPSGSSPARASSPIYLFAFQDHVIRAANAYWVEGKTLHYVTLQHDEKQAPIESLDRALTLQLNRERQVNVTLP